MNILFWNINKNSIEDIIVMCAKEYDLDVIFLAEHSGVDSLSICRSLDEKYYWANNTCGCDKIRMLAKRSVVVEKLFEVNRYLISTVRLGNSRFNIASLHLEDKRNYERNIRLHTARKVAAGLLSQEYEQHCTKSIVIGDFNANPFDEELLTMDAFGAIPFKDVVKCGPKKRLGEEYTLMYNPTLHYLNEETKNYGSYYYSESGNLAPLYWHCFDQAIVSSSLLDDVIQYSYLRSIAGISLMSSTRPKSNISDHLPLLVVIGE